MWRVAVAAATFAQDGEVCAHGGERLTAGVFACRRPPQTDPFGSCGAGASVCGGEREARARGLRAHHCAQLAQPHLTLEAGACGGARGRAG